MMNAASLNCPSCGGPSEDLPVDPKAPVHCPWCGSQYQRQSAESAINALKDEIAAWLQRTAGVSATEGAEAVDVATRSFLFNDRILPGLRRDVRRALDEGIGDVLGSPILVPPALRSLPGFAGEDCVLLTKRDQILALRSLRGRLEAPAVSAFATSVADQMELDRLRRDIDRAVLASNATTAIATEGLTHGATRARHNIEALRATASSSAIEGSTAPAEAALTRAFDVRCETLLQTLDAVQCEPVDVERLQACAARLEETSDWLLGLEERDLRGALASTGLHRDATAIGMLCAIAEEAVGAGLPTMRVVEELHVASELLSAASRAVDAIALVRSWTRQIAAVRQGRALSAVQDVAWVNAAVQQACRSGERAVGAEVVFAPYWAMSARHAKAEGLFFVSGKQYEGLALVPASANDQGTLLLGLQDHLARWVQHAIAQPTPVAQSVDVPCIGPSAARETARRVLRSKDLRNVSIGDPQLVFIPVAIARFEGAGARVATLALMGPVPHDPGELARRIGVLKEVAGSLS